MQGYDRTAGYYGRYPQVTGEDKFFDGSKASTTSATGGTIFDSSLVKIPQGTEEKERIGRKCVIDRIAIRGNVLLPANTNENLTNDTVRIIIYQDKQTNGAAAVVTDILESAAWNSYNNLANSQRFRVLHSEFIEINSLSGGGDVAADTSDSTSKYFDFYKKCNIVMEFDSTAGAITEMKSNNIGVLVISRLGEAFVEYRWRVRFTG